MPAVLTTPAVKFTAEAPVAVMVPAADTVVPVEELRLTVPATVLTAAVRLTLLPAEVSDTAAAAVVPAVVNVPAMEIEPKAVL